MNKRASSALRIAALGILFTMSTAHAHASGQQSARIVVGTNDLVWADSLHPFIEPHLAVSPVDANHIVAAASRTDSSWYHGVALSSWDTGETWRLSVLAECDLDAWVAFLPGGDPLISCLERGDGPASILVYGSQDGGRTWDAPARVPRGGGSFDHPSIAVDLTNRPTRGKVYANPKSREPRRSPSMS